MTRRCKKEVGSPVRGSVRTGLTDRRSRGHRFTASSLTCRLLRCARMPFDVCWLAGGRPPGVLSFHSICLVRFLSPCVPRLTPHGGVPGLV